MRLPEDRDEVARRDVVNRRLIDVVPGNREIWCRDGMMRLLGYRGIERQG